jgi:BirA family biotin operon repressor/biotin-[acetyl-CoA-carboxylase] ligase
MRPVRPMPWPVEDLWLALQPVLPGFTVEVLAQIDSTNTELMRRAHAGRTEATLLIAEQQTQGRGRLGRPWSNTPGDSLMMSLGLMLAPQDWSGLSLAVGLAVVEALHASGMAQSQQIGLKWPNDLWLRDGRKLGGILIETTSLAHHVPGASLQQQARYVVIGLGMNIVQPQAGADWSTPPTSLRALDTRWTAPLALAQILPPLAHAVLAFAAQGFAPLVQRFAAVDVLRGQPIHTSDGIQGVAQGVGPDGALLVQTAQGLQALHSADVSVRPQHMALPPQR